MAKYPVICERCGKEYTVNLLGNHKKRKRELGVDDFDELPIEYGTCGCEKEVPDHDWAR